MVESQAPPAVCHWSVVVCVGVLLSVLPYLSDLDGGIVYDDKKAIANPDVYLPNITLQDLLQHDFWGNDMWADRRWTHNSYRPLTVLSFRLQYLYHGYELRYFHIANLAVHAAATLAAAAFMLQEFGPRRRLTALLATALFAAHPIHTEVVSNMTGRCEPLCSALVLVALLLYSWAIPTTGGRYQPLCRVRSPFLRGVLVCGSIVVIALATLAKETALVAPALCICYDAVRSMAWVSRSKDVQDGGSWRKQFCTWVLAPRVLAMTTFMVVLGYVRVIWLTGGYAIHFSDFHNPILSVPSRWARFLSIANVWTTAAGLLAWPVGLAHERVPYRPVRSWCDRRNVWTVAAACLALWLVHLAWRCLRRLREGQRTQRSDWWAAAVALPVRGSATVALWLVLVLVPYLPASHVFVRTAFVVPERQLFLPSLGFAALLAEAVVWCSRACAWHGPTAITSRGQQDARPVPLNAVARRTVVVALLLWTAIVSFYVHQTWNRNRDWHSESTLLDANLRLYPMNSMCLYAKGSALVHDNPTSRLGEALLMRSALSTDNFANGLENLADIALKRGDIDLAITYTEMATYRGSSAHLNTNLWALTEGKYSLEKREFFAILALHSHALSSTEGYKIGVVVNNGACVIATTANRQFYNPVYALNLLKEAYEVRYSSVSEMASYNFALVKLALGHVDGAIEAANMGVRRAEAGEIAANPGHTERIDQLRSALNRKDLHDVLHRPADEGDDVPHVGETLELLGLRCGGLPLLSQDLISIPKSAAA